MPMSLVSIAVDKACFSIQVDFHVSCIQCGALGVESMYIWAIGKCLGKKYKVIFMLSNMIT